MSVIRSAFQPRDEQELEQRIFAATSRKAKQVFAGVGSKHCIMRILAETTLELDPRKLRVEIEQHSCAGDPPCPAVMERMLA